MFWDHGFGEFEFTDTQSVTVVVHMVEAPTHLIAAQKPRERQEEAEMPVSTSSHIANDLTSLA